jgi:hypothetical protein
MRTAFLDFLAAEGVIAPEQMDQIQSLLRAVPEPIGSIAFSYGMTTGNDIDAILDDQRTLHRPFGEIAVSRGILTQQQVETLLGIQRMRAVTEVAEALALAGVCPMEEVVTQLGRFLSKYQDTILCSMH